MQLPNNAISAEDAARMIGITPKRLRELMRAGKIKGVKIKKYWYCDLDSVREHINSNGSRKSDMVVINGEKYISYTMFRTEQQIIVKNIDRHRQMLSNIL